MSEAGSVIARFDFTNGSLRGGHLTLHPGCLVYRGGSELETLPLAALASVRVVFERDSRKLGWGAVLVVLGLLLAASAAPLAAFADSAAAEMAAAGSQGVARALLSLFRFLEFGAGLLPALGALAALGGVALAVFGWLGSTRLTLTSAGYERSYPARGRDTRLLDFAELVAERLISIKR